MKRITFLKRLTFVFFATTTMSYAQSPFLQWDFNNDTDIPSLGTTTAGSITLVGGTTNTYASGSGSSDTNTTNRAFNTTNYAASLTENKQRGIQINANTTGYSNITLSFDQRMSNTANNTYTVQYTTDAAATSVVWTDMQTLTLTPAPNGVGDTWHNVRSVDFSTITALNNNPAAAFRVVSTFDVNSTPADYTAARSTSTYGTGGTVRFDMITVAGNTFVNTPTVTLNPTSLNFLQITGAPSQAQAVTVTGTNLTTDIVLTATAPYEIALSATGTYAATQTLTLANAGYSGDVYVRLNSTSPNTSNGTLTAQTTGVSPDIIIDLDGVTEDSEVTNPAPFDLSTGNYLFDQWDNTSTAGTYPANMMFWINNAGDGIESTDTDEYFKDWICGYDISSASRILGEGVDGVSFINTGNTVQNSNCYNDPTATGRVSGKPGAAVLAINTVNRKNIEVEWTGRTIAPNNRVYALKLQYRIGDGNNNPNVGWQDFATVSEYVADTTAGHSQTLTTVLPTTAEDQAVVQLRWIYFQHATNTATGSRAQLALDDINVKSESALSTEKFEKLSFKLYPNPASDMVHFEENLNGSVYDTNGKKVLSFENTNSLNIASLKKGVYFIKTDKGATSKLIVK